MKNKDNRIRKKGFTLIELLVTLAIIAIIATLTFVVINNINETGKEVVTKVNNESLSKSAISYVQEFKMNEWEIDSDTVEYVCLSVNQLKNKGYFKGRLEDETGQPLDKTTLKVIRDSNKVISNIIERNSLDCNIEPKIEIEVKGQTKKYNEEDWYYNKEDAKVIITLNNELTYFSEWIIKVGSENINLDKLTLIEKEKKEYKYELDLKNINNLGKDIDIYVNATLGSYVKEESKTINVDFTKPTKPILKAEDNERLTTGKWHKNSFNLIVSGGGTSPSGNYYRYTTDLVNYIKLDTNKIIDTNNDVTYYVESCNNLDICSDRETYLSKIDKTLPIVVSFTKNTTSYAKSVTLTAKIKDLESGIVKYKISKDSRYVDTGWAYVTETTSEITKTQNVATNGTYYVWVEDKVGNYISSSIVINNIDNTGPTYVSGGQIGEGSVSEAIFSDVSTPVKIYYLIKTNNTMPTANQITSTTRTYTYNCGITYYAYAKAVDSLGNYTIKELGSKFGGSCCYKPLEKLGLNDLVKSGTPNFSTSATTDEGIYVAEDDMGTSYYFRGASTRNYVKFGKYKNNLVVGTDYDGNQYYYLSLEECEDILKNWYKPSYINRYPSIQRCSSIMKKGSDIYWRIIRINGDGSIRMIYDGTVAHDNGVSHGNRVIYPNQIKFGNNSIAIYATSYAYKHPFSGELQYNEIVKTVNSWYATYFSEAGGQYVADAIYCNDRVEKQSYVDGSGKYFGDSVILEYAPAQRIRYKIPSLKCSNYSDRNTIGSNIGNGYLTYPVGLITADEVMLAGATMMIDEYGSFVPVGNTKYYLYSGTPYWTMSPINSYSTFSYMFSVGGDGELNSNLQYSEFGLKPVISLKNNISFTGTGTKEDPFIPTGFCN